jgi:hypothetical protein
MLMSRELSNHMPATVKMSAASQNHKKFVGA